MYSRVAPGCAVVECSLLMITIYVSKEWDRSCQLQSEFSFTSSVKLASINVQAKIRIKGISQLDYRNPECHQSSQKWYEYSSLANTTSITNLRKSGCWREVGVV